MGPWVHWVHGPMGPWTHGPMRPWAHVRMDLWTHGAMRPWALVAKLLSAIVNARTQHASQIYWQVGGSDIALSNSSPIMNEVSKLSMIRSGDIMENQNL